MTGGQGGGTLAGDGEGLGGALFIQGGGAVTLTPSGFNTVFINSSIADAGGASSLVIDGPGNVTMSFNASYAGPITIDQGTLTIYAQPGAVSGPITDNGTLVFQQTSLPTVSSTIAFPQEPASYQIKVDDVLVTVNSSFGGPLFDLYNAIYSVFGAGGSQTLTDPGTGNTYSLNLLFDSAGQLHISDPYGNVLSLSDYSGTELAGLGLAGVYSAGPVTSNHTYPLTSGEAFSVNGTVINLDYLTYWEGVAAIANAVSTANIPNVSASFNATTGILTFTAVNGAIDLEDVSGTPLETLGITPGIHANTASNIITGNGNVTIANGSGTDQILVGGASWSGTTTINAGNTLIFEADTAQLGGNIVNNGTLIFSPASESAFTGSITGTGNVIIDGGASLTLLAANGYAGPTTVTGSGSTLSISSDASLGASGTSLSLGDGTALDITASIILDHAITVSGDPDFIVSAGQAVQVTALVSDGAAPGDVTLRGPGTLELGTTNSYSGGTVISQGTLQLDTAGAAGSGAITFGGPGTLRIEGSVLPVNTIAGLSAGDTIDLAGAGFNSAATVSVSGSQLMVAENGASYALSLDASTNLSGDAIILSADSGGGTAITLAALGQTLSGHTEKLTGGGSNSFYTLPDGVLNVTFLGSGAFTATGNASANQITGAGGNDILSGGGGADTLIGNGGNDTLNGGNGSDALNGGDGNDTLNGGAGNDVLTGGAGQDIMTGGSGADHFRFLAASDSTVALPDIITDFSTGQHDKLDFSKLDAALVAAGGTALHLGGAAFTGSAGELIQYGSGKNTMIAGDLNGDGVADFVIQLNGHLTLNHLSFIF